MFESNSRCARGQGLNMKVPGCGVTQRKTGSQCEHSLVGGGGCVGVCVGGSRPPFQFPVRSLISHQFCNKFGVVAETRRRFSVIAVSALFELRSQV